MRAWREVRPVGGADAARRRGFGIRGKLFLAFGGVAGLTVLAALVALLSYDDVGMALRRITQGNLPAMSLSLRLVKSSEAIESAAPAVLAAADLHQRDTALAALASNQHAFDATIVALAATAGGNQAAAGLRQTADAMRGNLDRLSAAVGQRLALGDQRLAMAMAISAAAEALDKKLAPLVDDTNFTLVTGLQGAADGASDTKVIQQRLSDLADKQLGALQAMLDLRADADLALGLLIEAANIPDKDLLPPVRDSFAAAAGRIGKSLDGLKATRAAGALGGPVADLLRYGNGATNIFDLRRRELEATVAGETILVANRNLADALAPLVATLVEHNERAAQQAAKDTGRTIGQGRVLLIGIAAASLVIALTIAVFYVGPMVVRRLKALRRAMAELAGGDLDVAIPQTGHDEIADMAGAVVVFKEHMARARHLAAEQERERAQAAAAKQAALVGMADKIETETTTALHEMAARTIAMTATADKMSALAVRTGDSAQGAATASAQALANAQTVASAAEQLSASIREIGNQVVQSNAAVGRAVAAGSETRSTIEALNDQVTRIGAVAGMIGEIASRTNLLALNATIEAARAGDAGKGFAVVASEVKALATQTARSTQEIAQHIDQVRSATGASVAAVVRIEQTIGEISAIAGSIAAAVEEQGAATAEIARNVAETASAANEMSSRTTEVSSEAEQTGKHADEVRAAAVALNTAMGELHHSVIRVVRTSTTDVDRRRALRYDVDLPCRLTVGGQVHAARVVDLSDTGAHVHGAPALQLDARGTLDIDGVGVPLPFIVRQAEGGALRVAFALDATTEASFSGIAERLAQRRAA